MKKGLIFLATALIGAAGFLATKRSSKKKEPRKLLVVLSQPLLVLSKIYLVKSETRKPSATRLLMVGLLLWWAYKVLRLIFTPQKSFLFLSEQATSSFSRMSSEKKEAFTVEKKSEQFGTLSSATYVEYLESLEFQMFFVHFYKEFRRRLRVWQLLLIGLLAAILLGLIGYGLYHAFKSELTPKPVMTVSKKTPTPLVIMNLEEKIEHATRVRTGHNIDHVTVLNDGYPQEYLLPLLNATHQKIVSPAEQNMAIVSRTICYDLPTGGTVQYIFFSYGDHKELLLMLTTIKGVETYYTIATSHWWDNVSK